MIRGPYFTIALNAARDQLIAARGRVRAPRHKTTITINIHSAAP